MVSRFTLLLSETSVDFSPCHSPVCTSLNLKHLSVNKTLIGPMDWQTKHNVQLLLERHHLSDLLFLWSLSFFKVTDGFFTAINQMPCRRESPCLDNNMRSCDHAKTTTVWFQVQPCHRLKSLQTHSDTELVPTTKH